MSKVRLAGIIYDSLCNGDGIRTVLFAQGCPHNCEGCHTPHTHSYEDGELIDVNELIEKLSKNKLMRGITLSGGDPFEQADKFAYIAKSVKENNKDVWCYTGYTLDYILEHLDEKEGWRNLINNIDVLVDGKFQIHNKVDNLKFKGSSNQRIIDMNNFWETMSIEKSIKHY